MKRFVFLPLFAFALLAGTAYAAAQSFALNVGDTLSVSCPGSLSGTIGPNSAQLSCAPSPTMVWKVPTVVGVGQSQGYDPGTDPAIEAFRCNDWWNGNDDDDTWLVVRFPQPTTVAGFRFGTLAASGAHSGYSTHMDFRASQSLVKHDELPASPAPFLHIDQALLPMVQTSPGVWAGQVTQVERTFAPVTLTTLRIDMFDIGSWTTLTKVRILTPTGTPGTVC